ncbi:hypothetical protein KIH87_09865 [Paraneptunicella aestuarii]|uniref:hypothetical protein n=1 Tax=Paraneptunicella aestuarii TaxID=2831148 RepID=UPI001E418A48|nr:hypothetical protein [Paraneptunicella aestuarii]UAA40616.1 hypothetical protein KIH87_09865 [Paraneptunicella aestuarii]
MIARYIFRAPFIGSFFRLANAYACKGDPTYTKNFAPLSMWCERVFPSFYWSIILGSLITIYAHHYGNHDFDAGEYIIGAIPSLLGFGIGVFALIFVLPSTFLNLLDNSVTKTSVRELPANIGYPLMGMGISLLISFMLQVFDNANIKIIFLESTLTVYSFKMVIDLIEYITVLGRVSIKTVADEYRLNNKPARSSFKKKIKVNIFTHPNIQV